MQFTSGPPDCRSVPFLLPRSATAAEIVSARKAAHELGHAAATLA